MRVIFGTLVAYTRLSLARCFAGMVKQGKVSKMRIKTVLLTTMLSGALMLPMAASATIINGVNIVPGSTFVLSNLFEEAAPSVNADGSYTNVFGNTITSVSGSNFVASSSRTITSAGQILRGIGTVSEVENGNGQAVWTSGNNGTFLSFAFDNYVAESVSASGGTINVNFSRGLVNYFTSTTNTFNAGLTKDGNTSDEFATVTGGTPWLSMTGANTGVSTGKTSFNGAGQAITLQGTASGSLSSIGAGTGSGLYNVVGGPAEYKLNTNTFPFGADVTVAASFNSAPPVGDFALSGSTTQKFNAIPEPTPIAILAVGLLGLALMKRQKGHQRLG